LNTFYASLLHYLRGVQNGITIFLFDLRWVWKIMSDKRFTLLISPKQFGACFFPNRKTKWQKFANWFASANHVIGSSLSKNKRMNESEFSPNKTGTRLHLMRFFYHKMESHWYCLKCGLEFIAFFLLLLNQFKSWAIIWVMKVYLLKKLHFSFCYSIEWKQIMFCKTLKR
jgi:hypothetical protein